MEKQEYNGYCLIEDFTNDKSGNGRWTFASKQGKEYFIKEFLNPVYPINADIFSPETLKRKKEACLKYESEKSRFYRMLNDASDGNAVRVQAFFRCEGKYYITMEKLHNLHYVPYNISVMTFEQKKLFCRVLAHSLAKLHEAGIVHADLKWDNLVFTQARGQKRLTVKLIDFDNSFLAGNQPDCEEMGMDPVYCAPETVRYLNEEPIALDGKIDIFALGIIYHQIFSGVLPLLEDEEGHDGNYKYVFECLMNGGSVKISPLIPKELTALLKDMLQLEPDMRPTAEEVFEGLGGTMRTQAVQPERAETEEEKAESREKEEAAVKEPEAMAPEVREPEAMAPEVKEPEAMASEVKEPEPPIKSAADEITEDMREEQIRKDRAEKGAGGSWFGMPSM